MAWKSAVFSVGLLLSDATLAQSADVLNSVSGPIDGVTRTEDLTFKNDAHQRMTVPVHVTGAGPFRFMVDTAADRTAISRELAQRLKLAAGSSVSLHSVAGVSKVDTVLIKDLRFSRKSVKAIQAPMLESENIGADGILGVDSLRSQRVEFDFGRNLMSIVPSASTDHIREPDAIVIMAKRRNGRLILADARVNGKKVTVILDTGSEVSLANDALRRVLQSRESNVVAERVELHSVTGTTLVGETALVAELEMGGVTLKGLSIVFADAHTFRKLDLTNRPSLLLGMNAIRGFKRVSIDFANRKFRVVLPESSSLDHRLAANERRLSQAL